MCLNWQQFSLWSKYYKSKFTTNISIFFSSKKVNYVLIPFLNCYVRIRPPSLRRYSTEIWAKKYIRGENILEFLLQNFVFSFSGNLCSWLIVHSSCSLQASFQWDQHPKPDSRLKGHWNVLIDFQQLKSDYLRCRCNHSYGKVLILAHGNKSGLWGCVSMTKGLV